MKRAFFLIAIIICSLTLLLPLSAQAHSGRTDSNDGHYDRSTGEYHYHHGFPPHQHPNGICPYDFIDNTDHSSGSSSGSSGSSSELSKLKSDFIANSSEDNSTSKGQSAKDDSKATDENLLVSFILLAIILYVIHNVVTILPPINKVKCLKSNAKDNLLSFLYIATIAIYAYFIYNLYPFLYFVILISFDFILCYVITYLCTKKQLKKAQQEEELKIKEYEEQKSKYNELYSGKSIHALTGAPADSYLDNHGLPAEINKTGGGKYIFRYSPKSKKYHTTKCRYAKTCSLINALDIKRNNYTPCKICKPQLPDLSWVDQYRHIQQIKEKYHIDMKD